MAFNEDRQILNLTDSELEDLIKKWLAKLADTYVGFERPSSTPAMLAVRRASIPRLMPVPANISCAATWSKRACF
jgi:hypothetical protein